MTSKPTAEAFTFQPPAGEKKVDFAQIAEADEIPHETSGRTPRLLHERVATAELPGKMFENLAPNRVEIDQIVMRGGAFVGCDMRELHIGLARDRQAEAVTFDLDGTAVAANEFLYKKSVVIVGPPCWPFSINFCVAS